MAHNLTVIITLFILGLVYARKEGFRGGFFRATRGGRLGTSDLPECRCGREKNAGERVEHGDVLEIKKARDEENPREAGNI